MENQQPGNVVVRNNEVFVKPENPLDPHESNWDIPINERVQKLEDRLLDLEINLMGILKSMVDEITKYQKRSETAKKDVEEKHKIKSDSESDDTPDIEIKKIHLENLPKE